MYAIDGGPHSYSKSSVCKLQRQNAGSEGLLKKAELLYGHTCILGTVRHLLL